MSLDPEALETSFDLVAPRGDELRAPRRLRRGARALSRRRAVLIASTAYVAGPAWRLEFEQAWGAAFEIVAGAVIEGAESVAVEVAA